MYYEADVNIEIKSGVCTQTTLTQLALTPNADNSDTFYVIALEVDGMRTECTFTTEGHHHPPIFTSFSSSPTSLVAKYFIRV